MTAGRCLLACVVLLSLAAPVWAQAREEDPLPILFGPLGLRPRLVFSSVGVDSNVFNERDDRKRDFTATVTPALDAVLRVAFARFSATSSTDLVYYHQYESERSADPAFRARIDLELGRFRPYAAASAQRTQARLNREIDERALRTPRSYGAGIDVKLFTRTTAGFRFRRDTTRFDQLETFRGTNLSEVFDNEITVVEGSFGVELTPLTSFSVIVSREEAIFDTAPIRNSETLRVAPTLTFSPLGLINGSATFGYRRFEGKDPRLPEYSGFVAAGSVGVLLANRVKLDTTFQRDVQYSYEEQLPYYLLNAFRVTASTPAVGSLDVRATGGIETSTYRGLGGESPGGTDHFVVYGGGVGYRFAETSRLGMDVEVSERTSERDPVREYRATRVFASFTWGASR